MGERIMEAMGLKTHEPVIEVRHLGYCKPEKSIAHTFVLSPAKRGTSSTSSLQMHSLEVRFVNTCGFWEHACVCYELICAANSLLGLHAQSHDAGSNCCHL